MHDRNALEFECTASGASVPFNADDAVVGSASRACRCKNMTVKPSPTRSKPISECVPAVHGYGWAMAQLGGLNSSVRVTETGYDQVLQNPFFIFTTGSTSLYQVWYEDAQSLSKVNNFLLIVPLDL
jgi:spore germination protein YaaH|eukprot:COSAG02_NODE_296_length_25401_cov_7.672437_2_plen_126_part_00